MLLLGARGWRERGRGGGERRIWKRYHLECVRGEGMGREGDGERTPEEEAGDAGAKGEGIDPGCVGWRFGGEGG